MASKNISVDFFRLSYPEDVQQDIFAHKLGLLNQLEKQKKRPLENIKLFDYYVRIRDIWEHNATFVINIEKIKVNEYAYVGDLNGLRQTLAEHDDEGPLSDTVLLYWPECKILAIYRTREGLSHKTIEHFLDKLLGTQVSLEIIITTDALFRLKKMKLIKKMIYKIAKPTKTDFIKSNKTGFFEEASLINFFNSDNLDIVIAAGRGNKLDNKNIVEKAEYLAKRDETSKLRVEGFVTEDGEKDVIDLINSRMVFNKKVSLPKGKKITTIMMKDLVIEAFDKYRGELWKLYS